MKRFRFSRTVPVLFAVLLTFGCQSDDIGSGRDGAGVSASSAPTSARELISAMHARYADAWYKTLTFDQETIQYRADGADTSRWYEGMRIPGQLRIDIGSPGSGDAYIFRNDSLYVFADSLVVKSQETLHPLLLLGFDVYGRDPDAIMIRLDSLGFDMNEFNQNEWQGRPVYVVGAEAGDESRSQFWIDAERMLFVRMIQAPAQDGAPVQEVQFNGYVELGSGWISPEVDIYNDGTLIMTERYDHIEGDVELDPALFEPSRAFTTPHWVKGDDS